MKNIKYTKISYPVTAIFPERHTWINGKNCKSIEMVTKNGEMASIEWFRIELNDGSFEEVIGSACVIEFTAERESF